MLAVKLISILESDSGVIVADAVRNIRTDPITGPLAGLNNYNLVFWARALLAALHPWLLGRQHERVASHSRGFAAHCCRDGIPLSVVIRGLHILKHSTLEFMRNLGLDRTAFEIYVEEEFEHGLGEYFDFIAYHLVRGYEEQKQSGRTASEMLHMAHAAAL